MDFLPLYLHYTGVKINPAWIKLVAAEGLVLSFICILKEWVCVKNPLLYRTVCGGVQPQWYEPPLSSFFQLFSLKFSNQIKEYSSSLCEMFKGMLILRTVVSSPRIPMWVLIKYLLWGWALFSVEEKNTICGAPTPNCQTCQSFYLSV